MSEPSLSLGGRLAGGYAPGTLLSQIGLRLADDEDRALAMITSEGWYDWGQRMPGPSEKTGYGDIRFNSAEGVVYHSAEGYGPALLGMVSDMSRRASWTASNLKDGRFIQHYQVTRVVWTNGSREANLRFRGIENEGVAGEPLTEPQVANLVRCTEDMASYFQWPRIVRQEQLWEHRELTRFGASATACPSGRIPWAEILRRLGPSEEEEDLEILGQYAKQVPGWDRSYIIFVTAQGKFLRALVPNAATYKALAARGFPTKEMSAAEINSVEAVPGTPDA